MQRCAVSDRRDRPPQAKPVSGRHVVLGDREEARQSRLGGEQVVAARVERAVGGAVTDGQGACAPGRAGSRSPLPAPSRGPSPRGRATADPARAFDASVCARSRRQLSIERCTASAQNNMSPCASSACSLASATRAVGQRRGMGREIVQNRDVDVASLPRARRECVQCIFDLMTRDGLRAPIIRQCQQRLAGELHRVLDTGDGGGVAAAAPTHSRQALATAIRCAARLPLSTDETYRGSSGRRSRVSYQL